ncbi:hypothetical protein [Suttonella ornithocola]|uniref:Predicted exporter n=1 Tax=Suttonella ornithocola TaxID=279832 RepID=A0A380MRT7_9GAMM|nr:hypothetical protein [Suttonella ornithocola]SUO95022.1 Predicted exporter [Suttonella ornithocola]
MRRPAFSYAIILLLFAVLVGSLWTLWRANTLQTDLQQLLPESEQLSVETRKALAQQQQITNQQVLMMIGANSLEAAKALAEQLRQQGLDSGVFRQAQWQIGSEIEAWRQSAEKLGSYLLTSAARQQIIAAPEQYAAQWAAEMSNPFSATLLPLSQDWLGFSRFYQAPTMGNLSQDFSEGSVYTEVDGTYWLALRAELARTVSSEALLQWYAHTKKFIAEHQAKIAIAAPALFQAEGKVQGEKEGKWLSIIGLLATVLLFALVFGRWRVLLLIIPAVLGMLSGILAVLLCFGQIHILTLIIGTSLLGLLLDVPLHWLAKSFVMPNFCPETAMRALRRPFFFSTAITLIGYLLLLAAPLPVLQQTAIYSAVALSVAVLVAFFFLPSLFQSFIPAPRLPINLFLTGVEKGIDWLNKKIKRPLLWVGLGIFIIGGIWQGRWHEDIADWVRPNPVFLNDLKQVSILSGQSINHEFILTEAENSDALIRLNRAVKAQLQPFIEQGKLGGMVNISDFAVTTDEQVALRQALKHQNLRQWQPLVEMGIAPEMITRALKMVTVKAPTALSEALNEPLGEPWRALLLNDKQAVIRLSEIKDLAGIQTVLKEMQGAQLITPRQQISAGFDHMRQLSLLLKGISYGLAALLLALWVGWKRALTMLAIPLAAVVFTVASLGWLGIALSAFSIFGLLLVMAIGVDYAIYGSTLKSVIHQSLCLEKRQRLAGMLMALTTTLLTFGLLAFSSTPVVVGFGASVSFGIFFSAILSMIVLEKSK